MTISESHQVELYDKHRENVGCSLFIIILFYQDGGQRSNYFLNIFIGFKTNFNCRLLNHVPSRFCIIIKYIKLPGDGGTTNSGDSSLLVCWDRWPNT